MLRDDVPIDVLAQFLELAYDGLVLHLAMGRPGRTWAPCSTWSRRRSAGADAATAGKRCGGRGPASAGRRSSSGDRSQAQHRRPPTARARTSQGSGHLSVNLVIAAHTERMTYLAAEGDAWGIPGPTFLMIYFVLGVVVLGAVLLWRRRQLAGPAPARPAGS